MTGHKAFKLMKEHPGIRFTHPFFSEGEWITMMADKETIVDELGYKLYLFWESRGDSEWEKGWSVHPTSPINPT